MANTIRCYKQFLCRKDKNSKGMGKFKKLNKFKELSAFFMPFYLIPLS
jgi:hypothetical protein